MRIDDPDIFRNISENLQIGLYLTDRERRIVFWNHEAERITGYLSHEVVGRTCSDGLLMHCDSEGNNLCFRECPLSETIQDGIPREDRVYLHHKAGHRVPVRVRAFPVRRPDGVIIGAVEIFEEQSTLLASDRRQSMLAAHGFLDAATGLPNHAIMQFHLRENMNLYTEHHLPFAVLVVQIQGVHDFEQAHSREALNAILHVVARSISHMLGADCLLGHWAENEFLATLSDCGLPELERLCKHIRELVSCSGIQWWGDQLSVAAQVGYAIVEPDDDAESLLQRAQQSVQKHAASDKNHSCGVSPERRPPGS